MQVFFDQKALNTVSAGKTRGFTRDVCVVEESENHFRVRIDEIGFMWWHLDYRQIVLKGFTQDTIECQIWPINVCFGPLI